MDATPAIRCRGLVKNYGALRAVDGLDLQVQTGECFGLLGLNGVQCVGGGWGLASEAGKDVPCEP